MLTKTFWAIFFETESAINFYFVVQLFWVRNTLKLYMHSRQLPGNSAPVQHKHIERHKTKLDTM